MSGLVKPVASPGKEACDSLFSKPRARWLWPSRFESASHPHSQKESRLFLYPLKPSFDIYFWGVCSVF